MLVVLWLCKPHTDQGCSQFSSKIFWMQYNDLIHQFLNLLYLTLTRKVFPIGRGRKKFSSFCFHSIYQWQPFCTAIVFKGYSTKNDHSFLFFSFNALGVSYCYKREGRKNPLRFERLWPKYETIHKQFFRIV